LAVADFHVAEGDGSGGPGPPPACHGDGPSIAVGDVADAAAVTAAEIATAAWARLGSTAARGDANESSTTDAAAAAVAAVDARGDERLGGVVRVAPPPRLAGAVATSILLCASAVANRGASLRVDVNGSSASAVMLVEVAAVVGSMKGRQSQPVVCSGLLLLLLPLVGAGAASAWAARAPGVISGWLSTSPLSGSASK